MKIESVSARVVDVGQGFSWGGRRSMKVVGVFVQVRTDAGVDGHAVAWTAELSPRAVCAAIEDGIAPLLEAHGPFDRPRLLAPAWRGFRVGTPLAALGVVDCALWDLAGKAAGVSVSELLGRRRDRLRGCASAPPCDTPSESAAMVESLAGEGFRCVKLHACGDVRADIASCRAARSAVGDGVDLMMDAMGIYDRATTGALGRVLDECAFACFEDPLADDDVTGWIELRRAISTPVSGVDAVRWTARDYAGPAAAGAFDVLRMDAARHGISQLHQLAELADAFSLGCEGHAFGPALAQAANLQVGLAARTARYCELPVPVGGLDLGVAQGLTLDGDGYVCAPPGPGLGLEVDLKALSRAFA